MFVVFTLCNGVEIFNREYGNFALAYETVCFLRSAAGVKTVLRAYRVVVGDDNECYTECYQPTEYGGNTCKVG